MDSDDLYSDDVLIIWPTRYKPLPKDYRVLWVGAVEHYMAFAPNGDESPINCNRFWCRRWCFAHHAKLELGGEP